MFGHYQDQLLVAQILSRHVMSIRGFVRPYRILRPQPCAMEQLLQGVRRERLLNVVDGLELHTLRGQDPLDLAALGSRRSLVNRDFGGIHFSLPSNRRYGFAVISNKFVNSL
jgi:hypothetical protein